MFKVLLVDDEELERKVLGFTLLNSGLPLEIVGEATNGRECLEVMSRVRPDLIIMDIKMPGIDGIEATKKVKELYPATQVIILTAYGKFTYSQQAIKAQAADYLLKPVQPRELIQAVQQLLERKERNTFHPLSMPDLSDYVAQIRFGNLMEGKREVRRLLQATGSLAQSRPEFLHSFAWRLLVISEQTLVAEGVEPGELARLEQESVESLPAVTDLITVQEWCEAVFVQCLDILSKRHPSHDQAIVHKAIEFIAHNFALELSLNQVAAQVHLSPAYFSRIFRKMTGVSFSEYLVQERIKAAKSLLWLSEETIEKIAARSGFSCNSYFASVFKKHEGITPSEYRLQTRV